MTVEYLPVEEEDRGLPLDEFLAAQYPRWTKGYLRGLIRDGLVSVDGQAEIKEPKGMYGGRLEANFHVVVGQVSSIKNIGRCIKSAGLDLQNITLEPLARRSREINPAPKPKTKPVLNFERLNMVIRP